VTGLQLLGEKLNVGGYESLGGVVVAVVVAANFIVFPFLPSPAVCFFTSRAAKQTDGDGERGRTETGRGWQGARESAVSAKRG
jgi:hypothetical protein